MDKPLNRGIMFDFNEYWKLLPPKASEIESFIRFRNKLNLISQTLYGISEKFHEEVKR